MSRKFVLIGLIAIALVITIIHEHIPEPPETYTLTVQFLGYIQGGLPEQDVFIEPGNILDELHPSVLPTLEPCTPIVQTAIGFLGPCTMRVDIVRPVPQDYDNQEFLSKKIYAASTSIPHDPYRQGPIPLGPFRKGDTMDITWGEWLAARGVGRYMVTDGNAQLDLLFTNLVPHGNYDLACSSEISSLNPSTVMVPCNNPGEILGHLSADAQGKARVLLQASASYPSNRRATTVLSLQLLRQIAPPGSQRGGYGLNKHVQLWYPFP